MLKKLIPFTFFLICFQWIKAQNEFITIWKPKTAQQIEFPGRGTNFQVYWEEIGYPQHNGTMNNITSTLAFTVNFGPPLNPVPSQATYRIKISNGNGSFDQVRFYDNTVTPIYNGFDRDKLIQIVQWGNIRWKSFDSAFVFCAKMDMTATDAPDLSMATSLRQMFYLCETLIGNSSFNTWNTSTITDMCYMFGDATGFNQPLGNWNTSNVTDMSFMFDNTGFNQPIGEWDTSKVITMEHMFHLSTHFNQDLRGWNTAKVINMNEMFHDTAFNQNLGNWNLRSLVTASDMFLNSSMSCQNYDRTLYGWGQNSLTPNSINLSSASPLVYSSVETVASRNHLINNKGWNISGDTYDSTCNPFLSTSESKIKKQINIYPNPAIHDIHIGDVKDMKNYKIFDMSGRLMKEGNPTGDIIDVSNLSKGNYILQLILKEGTTSSQFIKQ